MAAGSVCGVLGTGSYMPKDEVGNDVLADKVGVTAEWIERKTEILSRRFAGSDEATSDLATHAATEALVDSGIAVENIDYVIVSTSTPDSPQPPTAALVQDNLGAYGAACFDINVVCSGFVFGLALAHSLLSLKPEAHALVIASDVYSRFLNFDDRSTAVLLGDGAGAVVVGGQRSSYGIVDFGLHTRGDAHDLIKVSAGGSRLPASRETVDSGDHKFAMHGRKVREFVVDQVPAAISELLHRTGTDVKDVRHVVPHQPNGRLLTDLIARAGLGSARTHRTLEKYGNVGSACIPVTLDDAHRNGHFRPGDLMLLAGFGGGMSIATCLLRWAV